MRHARPDSANPPPLTFTYTNWRGGTAVRRVMPLGFHFGATEWHPEPQWLMDALDLDKGELRLFAMRDVRPAPPVCTCIQLFDPTDPPQVQVHGRLNDGSCPAHTELPAALQQQPVRFYNVADVVAVMGDDRPSAEILTARGLDMPWIKRLRRSTGCTFREARHAHDLLAHQHELTALRAAHSRRVTELLEANNREADQRRAAERHAQDLERRLAKEEDAHLRTIDDRDEAEAAFSTAFYMVAGRHPEWSNTFDYEDALEELQDHVAYLLAAEEQVQEVEDPSAREGEHAGYAVIFIFGLAFHALRGDMLATGIMLAFTLWHLVKAAVWAERASAAEVQHA